MAKVMDHSAAVAAFSEFLSLEYMEGMLQLWLEGRKLGMLSGESQVRTAQELFREHLEASGKQMRMGGGVVDQVQEEAKRVGATLATDSFVRFLQSPYTEQVLDAIVGDGSSAPLARPELLWQKYRVPADAAEWLYAFVGAAETFPACIVISDMAIPGNPMMFVNQEFTRVTGYSKDEAQGRNCRFLQGPGTEPASVAVIQDTLRRGVDCHVRLTNYRKNGDTFQNLLSMRPVHDTNGVYRFCIGVQFEVGRSDNLKERLKKLDSLLQLLPSRINVGAAKKRKGRTHHRRAVPSSVGKATAELLENALEVTQAVADTDIRSAARFAENRDVMLKEIGASSAGKQLSRVKSVRFS